MYLCKLLSDKRNAEIGKMFGITIKAVINTIKRIDKMREGDERFNK